MVTMAVFAASALPTAMPVGSDALAPGEHRLLPGSEPALLSWTRATADERWNLAGSVRRDPWESGPPMARFAARDALEGNASRAWLKLDWQRGLPGARLQARAFASRRDVAMQSGAIDTGDAGEPQRHLEQRESASTVGAFLALSRLGTRVSLAFRGDALDTEGRLNGAGGRALAMLRQDRLRQNQVALEARQSHAPAPWLRVEAGARLERYDFQVHSDLEGNTGAAAGALLSPRVSVFATLPARTELFLHAHRGPLDDEVRAGAALDPRSRAPLGRLDPMSTTRHLEAGLSIAPYAGLEVRGAARRELSASEVMLTASDMLLDFERPGRRNLLRLGARYHAASWMALDLEAARIDARFADGASEPIPGAARRYATAGATLRPGRGWSASLLVSHFATAASAAGEGARPPSSTLVSGRLTHNVGREARITLDAINLFAQRTGAIDYPAASRLWGQPGMAEDFRSHPGQPRGLRLRFRTTF